jgi:hypothetical protein
MTVINPILRDAVAAHEAGRYDDALRHLMMLYDQDGQLDPDVTASHFITTYLWELLVPCHPPAHEALTGMRDRQVRKLLAGDHTYSSDVRRPRSRFEVLVDMNHVLKDSRSTYEIFVQLESLLPDLARRQAYRALPAIVEAGDFARADRYLADPLDQLDHLNALISQLPLFPPLGAPPRLAGELSNFMRDVRLREAILRGLGREAESETLRSEAVAGIASDEMRSLALREIAKPGAIMREVSEHRIALDEFGPGGTQE